MCRRGGAAGRAAVGKLSPGMLRARIPLALVPVVLGATTMDAQGDPWEHQVRRQLARATETTKRDGYGPAIETKVGSLNRSESETLGLALQAGASYALIGVCDDDCTSLQLVLYNDAGTYEVAAERAMTETPTVRFTPREAARYRLKVVMAGCGVSPCWYGVGVYRR